jgi:hypothetical protein
MLVKVVSYLFIILFFWIIFPVRFFKGLNRSRVMRRRVSVAIAKANFLRKKTGKKQYVCRFFDEVFYGNSDEMKRTQKAMKKYNKEFNWKQAVVYEN